jgi:NADPH:quinone reductase-like Zn-dependent oxidoreductase
MIDRSKGDTIIDYRKGDEAVVQGMKDALKGQKLDYAYDAVAEKNSFQNIGQVLDPKTGKITLVLPPNGDWNGRYKELPEGIAQSMTQVGGVHNDLKDLGFVFSRYFTRGLDEGWFRGQPQEVVPGGLGGIQSALEKLKDGTVSAVKYVFRIADTEGAGSGS